MGSGLDNLLEGIRRRVNLVFKGREEFDLTEGTLARPLFYLSLPLVITNLLQTAYNLVDTIWLGQYGETELAAIGLAFPLVYFLISLGLGISIAGSILVAQNVGAGKERQAEFAASQTITFAFIAAVALGTFGYLFVGDLLRLIGGPAGVIQGATSYLQVVSIGMMFIFGFSVFISLMRGYGDTITPMVVMFVTVVINMVLDPFLIFGWWVFPELGILGAAYATVFARGFATVVGLWIMFKGNRGVKIHLRDMWPDLGYLRKILRVGLPSSVENTGNSIAIVLMLTIVTPFGETVIAAYTVGVRLFSVIFLPAIAVGQGVETTSGQNIGAGEYDRAGRATHFAARSMFLILAGIGVLTWLGAPNIVAVFSNEPQVIEVGELFLKYVAPTFGFTGIFHSYNGGFRGAGKTLTAAAISMTMLGLVRLPVAAVASDLLGSEGIWLAFAVSNVAGATIAFLWYRRGTWRGVSLTDGPGPTPGTEVGDQEPEPTTDD